MVNAKQIIRLKISDVELKSKHFIKQFVLESTNLLQSGRMGLAVAYILLSITASVIAVVIAQILVLTKIA